LLACMSLLSFLPLSGQLSGDGSMANPYSGFLAGNFTISGTKYFNGNIYVDNEILTVSAGATLIAVQNRASIFVTGTGQIMAVGTQISPILFTCDIDKDGINAEPGEYWGNININSSGASQITYCTFEWQKRLLQVWTARRRTASGIISCDCYILHLPQLCCRKGRCHSCSQRGHTLHLSLYLPE